MAELTLSTDLWNRMSFLSLLLNWNLVGSDELTGQQGFAKHAKHIITSNHLSV
jgi:hypothetical protein